MTPYLKYGKFLCNLKTHHLSEKCKEIMSGDPRNGSLFNDGSGYGLEDESGSSYGYGSAAGSGSGYGFGYGDGFGFGSGSGWGSGFGEVDWNNGEDED